MTGARVATSSHPITIGLAWTLTLIIAGCASPAPMPATPAPATREPTPNPTAAGPTRAPAATPVPTHAFGMVLVDVPEAGIRLPVPDAWERHGAVAFSDPAARAALAATYPGAGVLLGAVDELGGRAEPVLLAVDPSSVSMGAPIASNLSVLVSQPSVSGFLLDLVAGFIGDGLTTALGATEEPQRDRVQLPAGEAVRFLYQLPAGGDGTMRAVAWVIGAPAGTLLVTLMGAETALGDLDPDEIAAGIVPIPASGSWLAEPVALAHHAAEAGQRGAHPGVSMQRMLAAESTAPSGTEHRAKERG